jgi:hypothetical protein|eukprot:COSAG02_NODE_1202_length_13900_cov_144.332222_2_plen_149_part_00
MVVSSGGVRHDSTELTMPIIYNDRGIVVANDTHAFDLHQLSLVLSNGWVLLGDLERYVAASHKRFVNIRPHRSDCEWESLARRRRGHVSLRCARRAASRLVSGKSSYKRRFCCIVRKQEGSRTGRSSVCFGCCVQMICQLICFCLRSC